MQPNWQIYTMVPDVQDLGRGQAFSFPDVMESAIAGVSAALVATAILGVARLIRRWWARRRDVNYIRDILIEGQTLISKVEESFSEHANAKSTRDSHRAAEYNRMIEKLRVALEKWTGNLSHAQRRDLFDALDWYHTENLLAIPVGGEMQYVQPPEGRWYGKDMPLEVAEKKFERLQSIKWLKLERR